jgi:hypothetical protein
LGPGWHGDGDGRGVDCDIGLASTVRQLRVQAQDAGAGRISPKPNHPACRRMADTSDQPIFELPHSLSRCCTGCHPLVGLVFER